MPIEKISIKHVRNLRMVLNEVYFWKDKIKELKNLFVEDEYNQSIIDPLQWQVNISKIDL
jgi:hypothetical protein